MDITSLSKIRNDTEPFPHQIAAVERHAMMQSWLNADEPGMGKAAPLDEPILTPHGWRVMGDMKVGDEVIGADGLPVAVHAIHPRKNEQIYRVTFSDGSWTRCSGDHLWTVRRKGRSSLGWITVSTSSLHDGHSVEHEHSNGRTYRQSLAIKDSRGSRMWRIPMTDAVQYKSIDLPVDAYSLGAILGDGHITSHPTHKVQFSAKTDVLWFSLVVDGFQRSASSNTHTIDKSVSRGVHGLGLTGAHSWEKFIPEAYLRASVDERLALLRGLMDTDGTVQGQNSSTEYCTTSKQLCDDIVDLVQGLGGIARVRAKATPTYTYDGEMKTGRPAWRINIKLPQGQNPFLLPRKADQYVTPTKYQVDRFIESIECEGVEDAQCITIENPDGLYLTRGHVVTHNSLIALLVAAIDFERQYCERAIIVCPATLKMNWAAEVAKHTHFTHMVLNGSPQQRHKQLDQFEDEGRDLLIVNYEQLKPHMGALLSNDWGISIFDEAHYCKGYKTARTKLAIELTQFIPRSFLLTGTPVMNRVNELWPILHMIDPERWPRYWDFIRRYAVFGGYMNKEIIGTKNTAELTESLQSVMVRRLKKDTLDLPDKLINKVYVELHPKQKKIYDKIKNELKLEIPGNPNAMEIQSSLVAAGKLRMCATTPAALRDVQTKEPIFDDDSYKLDDVVAKVKETIDNGDRPLIFTEFRGVIAALERRFAKEKIPSWVLHGDVKQEKRVDVVDHWGTHESHGPLIAMIAVAGVGLNMAAYSSTVMFANKSWNPGKNGQAIDRIHRVGADMTKPIQIYDFIVIGTVDEKVEESLDLKTTQTETIVGDNKKLSAKLFAALAKEVNS